MESVELIKKLQVKPGQKLWLVNVPRDVAEALTAGAEFEIAKAGEACDGVIAFAHSAADVTVQTSKHLRSYRAMGFSGSPTERARKERRPV